MTEHDGQVLMPGETPSLGTLGAPLGPYWASVVRSPPPLPHTRTPRVLMKRRLAFFTLSQIARSGDPNLRKCIPNSILLLSYCQEALQGAVEPNFLHCGSTVDVLRCSVPYCRWATRCSRPRDAASSAQIASGFCVRASPSTSLGKEEQLTARERVWV